jgi:hypothetical protein
LQATEALIQHEERWKLFATAEDTNGRQTHSEGAWNNENIKTELIFN